MEVLLYKLIGNFREAAPKMIQRIFDKFGSAMVFCKDDLSISDCDKLLWMHSQVSFLPHITEFDLAASEGATPSNLAELYITKNYKSNPLNLDIIIFYDIDQNSIMHILKDGLYKRAIMIGDEHAFNVLTSDFLNELKANCETFKYFAQGVNGEWADAAS